MPIRSLFEQQGDLIVQRDADGCITFANDAYCELAGQPRDALMRVRPRLAVIDCDHVDACSDAFIGPARVVDLPGRGRHPADLTQLRVRDWADSVVADMDAAGLVAFVLVELDAAVHGEEGHQEDREQRIQRSRPGNRCRRWSRCRP